LLRLQRDAADVFPAEVPNVIFDARGIIAVAIRDDNEFLMQIILRAKRSEAAKKVCERPLGHHQTADSFQNSSKEAFLIQHPKSGAQQSYLG
jgi:hypothetical protein